MIALRYIWVPADGGSEDIGVVPCNDVGLAVLKALCSGTVPYPVGAVYTSMTSTDPGTLFGGTWSAIHPAAVPHGYSFQRTA